MSVTSVRIQSELSDRLEKVAGKLHRSKSSIINQAMEEFLDSQEMEEARWQETLDALASVREGRLVSADATHAWLESWGTESELPAPKPGQ